MKLHQTVFTGITLLILAGCTSHQYDALQTQETAEGENYSLQGNALIVQIQEYQFFPDTKSVMIECMKRAKSVERKLGYKGLDFDFVTERNPIGITSCQAIAFLE
ncbi:TPA: hypothetical protein KD105_004695 [Vibrio parahaemolyticus]|nr:hypothetical protein [Vibrio parahaemolyticus]HBC3607330.1 hypothetical protein [Vibrio parahaemolyticus]